MQILYHHDDTNVKEGEDLFNACFNLLSDDYQSPASSDPNELRLKGSIFVKPYLRDYQASKQLFGTKTQTVLMLVDGRGEMREREVIDGQVTRLKVEIQN